MSATLNCNIVTFHDGGGLDVKSWLTLEILWTVACQAPLSMGLFRQQYWSRLPFSPPGDLPNPGIELTSLTFLALASRFFTTSATWEALWSLIFTQLLKKVSEDLNLMKLKMLALTISFISKKICKEITLTTKVTGK